MDKKTLVFATNNKHKFTEIKDKLGSHIELKNLADIGFTQDIPETHDTIEENAAEKSFYIFDQFNCNCFADDTGLEIEALNGEPGVYSARYAGDNATFEDNMDKVLEKMRGIKNRKALFKTVISLIENGIEKKFAGIVKGSITEEKQGTHGFGYDPIFLPDGHNTTFAEMSLDEKNSISHRAKAVQKLIEYLNA